MRTALARIGRDARHYQIATLAALATYGLVALDFQLGAGRTAVILGGALGTQYVCGRLWGLPSFDPRSPLISGLSLCLLLRTSSIGLALAAAVLAIASKFLLRVKGRHVFNPTNFALVLLLALDADVWVSPGQWGQSVWLAFLTACVGGLVVNRAARSDVTVAFLAAYGAVLFGRSWWLGEPMAIPVHRLQSGALLVFAFFMISDPKTTPRSRGGRILFAAGVALGASAVQFGLFRTNGLFWSLAAHAPAVPLLDRLLPGPVHEWGGRRRETSESGCRSSAPPPSAAAAFAADFPAARLAPAATTERSSR
jgi:hypothetical protein